METIRTRIGPLVRLGCERGGTRRSQSALAGTTLIAGLCMLGFIVARRAEFQGAVALGSLMSEFSSDSSYAQSPQVATQGEMKASSDFYSDEGAAPKAPAGAWTGDGGAAFNFISKEAASPIDEALQDRQSTLDKDHPDDGDQDDLYGSWSGRGSGRGRKRQENYLQRMRAHEKERRSAEDHRFFAGVKKAFGKKTGDFLMQKFDPALKGQHHKRGGKRRQPRDRSSTRHRDRSGGSSGSSGSSSSAGGSSGGLQHVGVIGSAARMKRLFDEFKHAKGAKRKALLKGKVLALQKKIEGDFDKVDVCVCVCTIAWSLCFSASGRARTQTGTLALVCVCVCVCVCVSECVSVCVHACMS